MIGFIVLAADGQFEVSAGTRDPRQAAEGFLNTFGGKVAAVFKFDANVLSTLRDTPADERHKWVVENVPEYFTADQLKEEKAE